jgi:hypothetical protein
VLLFFVVMGGRGQEMPYVQLAYKSTPTRWHNLQTKSEMDEPGCADIE